MLRQVIVKIKTKYLRFMGVPHRQNKEMFFNLATSQGEKKSFPFLLSIPESEQKTNSSIIVRLGSESEFVFTHTDSGSVQFSVELKRLVGGNVILCSNSLSLNKIFQTDLTKNSEVSKFELQLLSETGQHLATVYLQVGAAENQNLLSKGFEDNFLAAVAQKLFDEGLSMLPPAEREKRLKNQEQLQNADRSTLHTQRKIGHISELSMIGLTKSTYFMVEAVGPLVDLFDQVVSLVTMTNPWHSVCFLLAATLTILFYEFALPAAMIGLAVYIKFNAFNVSEYHVPPIDFTRNTGFIKMLIETVVELRKIYDQTEQSIFFWGKPHLSILAMNVLVIGAFVLLIAIFVLPLRLLAVCGLWTFVLSHNTFCKTTAIITAKALREYDYRPLISKIQTYWLLFETAREFIVIEASWWAKVWLSAAIWLYNVFSFKPCRKQRPPPFEEEKTMLDQDSVQQVNKDETLVRKSPDSKEFKDEKTIEELPDRRVQTPDAKVKSSNKLVELFDGKYFAKPFQFSKTSSKLDKLKDSSEQISDVNFSSEDEYKPPKDEEFSQQLGLSQIANAPRNQETMTFTTYENQRWWFGRGWTDSLLPAERSSWSDASGQMFWPTYNIKLPGKDWQWTSEWLISKEPRPSKEDKKCNHDGNYDAEGWQYALDFSSRFTG